MGRGGKERKRRGGKGEGRERRIKGKGEGGNKRKRRASGGERIGWGKGHQRGRSSYETRWDTHMRKRHHKIKEKKGGTKDKENRRGGREKERKGKKRRGKERKREEGEKGKQNTYHNPNSIVSCPAVKFTT